MKRFILPLVLLALCAPAWAATYYADPAGSGSTCSDGSPCTIAGGVAKLSAGDTLKLKDGTYTGANQQLNVTISGTSGSVITIEAVTDGAAIIDAENAALPCKIDGYDYIDVNGIVCKNSSGHVFTINNADHINIRRVSAYTASILANYSVFVISGGSTYVLLEDCAAGGNGRDMYLPIGVSSVTLRRCFGRFKHYVYGGSSGDIVQIYNSNNVVAENIVGFVEGTPTASVDGTNIWNSTDSTGGANNLVVGNIMRRLTYSGKSSSTNTVLHNNRFVNNAYIKNTYGLLFQAGDDDGLAQNNTIIMPYLEGNWIHAHDDFLGYCGVGWNYDTYNNHFEVYNNPEGGNSWGFVRETSCAGTENHGYNNYYNITPASQQLYGSSVALTGVATEYCDEGLCASTGINPAWGTATYGDGAYVIGSAALAGLGMSGANIGASILYQYVTINQTETPNGNLTSTRLWPWPMEDRIFAETGVSVTYSANGGLFDTLTGVYAEAPPDAPTVSTSAASDIKATSFTANGEIVSDGGGTVSQHGAAYGTSVDPTIAGTKTQEGAGSEGSFTSSVTGLSVCQQYYCRDYATNETDTSYGSNVQIRTTGAAAAGDWTLVGESIYYRLYDIDESKVTANLNGLPVYISVTLGSNVASSTGYDVWLYGDAAFTSRLPAERESWNNSTKVWSGWVKSNVNTTTGGSIYFNYGDATRTDDPNSDADYGSAKVWDANYKGVLHLGDGTNLSGANSISGGATGTVNNAVASASGQMDGAGSFDGDNDNISLGDDAYLDFGTSDFTLSWWMKGGAQDDLDTMIYKGGITTTDGYWCTVNTNKIQCQLSDGGDSSTPSFISSSTVSDNVWTYVVATFDRNANGTIYINGEANGTPGNISGDQGNLDTGEIFYIGAINTVGEYTGLIDEVRASNILRSADWIHTEYHNQSDPATFGTLGDEVPPTGTYSMNAAASPYSVKDGSTVLTKKVEGVGGFTTCPDDLSTTEWCFKTDKLYAQTDGDNPGALTIQCTAGGKRPWTMMGMF